MTCDRCNRSWFDGDPADRSCPSCGYDPDDGDLVAAAEDASDHQMRCERGRRE